MRRVLTHILTCSLDLAAVHHETQGTRIEYDHFVFNISAEYNELKDTFTYSAFDVSDRAVTLTGDQTTIVYKFVKNLHDTNKDKDLQLRNQF